MFESNHNRSVHHIRGTATRRLFVSVGVLAALLFVLGAQSGGAPQANAADPDLEFNMEITSG